MLKTELNYLFLSKEKIIKEEIEEQKLTNGGFSLTLDAWTAINQDAYLGITIITRDNASSNDSLINSFRLHYSYENIKFEGDIPCMAHVLNLVVQDILKALIKDDYDLLNNNNGFEIDNDLPNNIIIDNFNYSIWKKIRKIIINLRYSQENARILKAQIEAQKIENPRIPQLDQKTRWSLTAKMLQDFLHLIKAINATIELSETKAFKDNKLKLSENEIEYLRKYLKIFEIFIKATTKLQAEKYPTIYYLIPMVYDIYNKLNRVKEELNNPTFSAVINKGIAKLRSYIPNKGNIQESNKSLYMALILDPRIRRSRLQAAGLSRGQEADTYNKLYADYQSYKRDYLNQLPPIQVAQDLNLNNNDNDLDIYLENELEDDMDELDTYLQERSSVRIDLN
ncbi:uncharacterized protein PAC_20205 [Phialocephala subalpina]|uniref:HAT C-terminal dimerisation domain-containing protein n=1 Tax=Phialocephala subalpina TaxID=576137 RepID=A0A1L7XZ07_9HELO|nr:uncharacterized protein PAC_20205 [Phialocephala subalpina]